MSILKILKRFEPLEGYLGAGVFSNEGKMMGGMTEISGINFEIAGSLFHDAFLFMNNNSKESGFGRIDTFQITTQKGIIICKCTSGEKLNFYTLLVVAKNTNIGMARLLLERTVIELKKIL